MPKLRYEEVDQLVEARRLPRAAVVTTLPAVTWDSRSRISTNKNYLRRRFPPQFEVPSLSLRAYDRVLCWPHQVLTMGGVLLPDSYRHFHSPRFNNHWLKVVEPNFAQYRRKRKKAVRLPGQYFYLGSEYPQHFGHVMTEQVSRLWAWRAAKERYPDLKALVSVSRVKDGLLPFEKAIFQAAGIAAEDLIGVKGFAKVDHLLAAAPCSSIRRSSTERSSMLWRPDRDRPAQRRLTAGIPREDLCFPSYRPTQAPMSQHGGIGRSVS